MRSDSERDISKAKSEWICRARSAGGGRSIAAMGAAEVAGGGNGRGVARWGGGDCPPRELENNIAKQSWFAKRSKGGRQSRLARGPPRRHLPRKISQGNRRTCRCRRGMGARQSPQKVAFRFPVLLTTTFPVLLSTRQKKYFPLAGDANF